MSKKQQINRRDFIKLSSIASASLPIALSGYPIYANEIAKGLNLEEDNENILVIIQLHGGNDGLNTFYNLNQYDNLQAVRSNIIIPENKLLKLNNKTDDAFHPCLTGLKEVWDQENLTIVQNVGYPNSNGSHFRSEDIWTSASDHDKVITTGWLGRYLAIKHPEFPIGYPNEQQQHPFALTIGKTVTQTCQGPISNFSMVADDPSNPTSIEDSNIDSSIYTGCYANKVDFVNTIANQTKSYTNVIKEAYDKGKTLSKKYGKTNNNQPGGKLRNIARLISGGLKTKIYTISLPGWDHHARLVKENERTEGSHTIRLRPMSDAIAAFQDDLQLLNIDHKVIGVVFSEFGRRIMSNKNLGTDHGEAGPVIMFGSCAANKFVGETPKIDKNEIDRKTNLPFKIDFRQINSTILQHWLGVSKNDAESVLFKDFETLPLFKKGCSAIINDDEDDSNSIKTDSGIKTYPNPIINTLNIGFWGKNEVIKISLFDMRGKLVKVIAHKNFSTMQHNIATDIQNLSFGTYILRFESKSFTKSEKIVKY